MRPVNAAEIVLGHTVVASPPLCPEIQLHLVTERCPLWRATEADLAQLGLPEPYWAFCWPGGQALARFLLDEPALVRGRTVLDFGAGCGVEAIAAMKAGAVSALAADIDAIAAEACRLNGELNAVQVSTTSEDVLGTDAGWDVVLAGDMFYERELAARAFAWLRGLARRGARVLLGDPHRGFLPPSGLRALGEYDAPADVDVGGLYRRRTTVFELLA